MKILILILIFGLLSGCSNSPVKKSTTDIPPTTSVKESVQSLIAREEYDTKSVIFGNSTIHLYGRKSNGLGLVKLEKSFTKMWPHFSRQFNALPAEAAIIDFDAPLGGGPLAPYVVGIFYSKQVSKTHQDLIRESTGWAPQFSTDQYIRQHYSAFRNPEEAYIDDMLVHELGHLIFGWGLTQVSEVKNDWWFSFGMGLIYDRLAWEKIYSDKSPLFSRVIHTWSHGFSKRSKVDQRLINPDTSMDQQFGLQRLQTYGHGKSYIFLKTLRKKIGAQKFDESMNSFISKSAQLADYQLFIDQFPKIDRKVISDLEKDLGVR